MKPPSHESSPATPQEAYEQNHRELVELMGRINARLAAKYRLDQPRAWEQVGEQEEIMAMLRSVAEFLEA
jgi:hypothetical protein